MHCDSCTSALTLCFATRDRTAYLPPPLLGSEGRRPSLLKLSMRARVLLPIIPSLKPKVEVASLDGGYSPLAISLLSHTQSYKVKRSVLHRRSIPTRILLRVLKVFKRKQAARSG